MNGTLRARLCLATLLRQRGAGTIAPGTEISGSDIRVGGTAFYNYTDKDDAIIPIYSSEASSGGTWRLQGSIGPYTDEMSDSKTCLCFKRIDGITASKQPSAMLLKSTNAESVRNCQYSFADNQMINCEVEANGKWHPFTASAADVTEWGRAIYAAAVAGVLGDVVAYVAPE